MYQRVVEWLFLLELERIAVELDMGHRGVHFLFLIFIIEYRKGVQEVALVGGACYYGSLVGAFASNLNNVPSQVNWNIGASISY